VVVKQSLVEINPRNINKAVAVVAVVESRPEKIDAPRRFAPRHFFSLDKKLMLPRHFFAPPKKLILGSAPLRCFFRSAEKIDAPASFFRSAEKIDSTNDFFAPSKKLKSFF
jgi:hypothetical protein